MILTQFATSARTEALGPYGSAGPVPNKLAEPLPPLTNKRNHSVSLVGTSDVGRGSANHHYLHVLAIRSGYRLVIRVAYPRESTQSNPYTETIYTSTA